MLRFLTGAGSLYLLFCSVLLLQNFTGRVRAAVSSAPPATTVHGHTANLANLPRTSGAAWFEKVKPFCNAAEAESRTAAEPPPDTVDGTAYSAGCFALAGKLDRAGNLIRQLSPGTQAEAAGVVFELGHAVADGGDEKSAAPLLRLALEFQPDNPMALYHLGMVEYPTDPPAAKKHLARFLELHPQDDASSRNAQLTLGFIDRR